MEQPARLDLDLTALRVQKNESIVHSKEQASAQPAPPHSPMMAVPSTMAILGCGNMGKAILDGILTTLKLTDSSSLAPRATHGNRISLSRFIACVGRPESIGVLEDRYRPYLDQSATSKRFFPNSRPHSPTVSIWAKANAKAVALADVILLACQPSQAASILGDPCVRHHLHHKLLISICVGVSAAKIQELISTKDTADHHSVGGTAELTKPDCYIVHAMPNMASDLGQSATVLSTGSSKQVSSSKLSLSPDLEALVMWIFRCIGTTTSVPAELMNAASVVGASTPAFFAMVLDGIVKGGVERGLSESDALRLAAQAMKGTAELVLRGLKGDGTISCSPSQIKQSVMTPNGCTERGVKVMTAHQVEDTTADATSQAIDRVFELGLKSGT